MNDLVNMLHQLPSVKLLLATYDDLRIAIAPVIIIDDIENVEILTGRHHVTLHSHVGKKSVTGGGVFPNDCIYLRQTEIQSTFTFGSYILQLIRTSLNNMVFDVNINAFRIDSYLSLAPSTFAHGQVYHAEAFLSEALQVNAAVLQNLIDWRPHVVLGQIESHQFAAFLKADVLNNQKAEPYLFNVLVIGGDQRNMYRKLVLLCSQLAARSLTIMVSISRCFVLHTLVLGLKLPK